MVFSEGSDNVFNAVLANIDRKLPVVVVVSELKSTLVSDEQPLNIDIHELLPVVVAKELKSALVNPVQPSNIL